MTRADAPDFSSLNVGVLELQGDFAEHTAMLHACGVRTVNAVKQVNDLHNIDALIIPGGESTVISKLLIDFKLMQPIRKLVQDGLPVFGTCAGLILLARHIRQFDEQQRIGVLDVVVDRNAYGSQIDSFESFVTADVSPFQHGAALRAVHIRAPAVVEMGEHVQVLAAFRKRAVLVRQGNVLGCTFHPELTDDTRVHQLFLHMVLDRKRSLS